MISLLRVRYLQLSFSGTRDVGADRRGSRSVSSLSLSLSGLCLLPSSPSPSRHPRGTISASRFFIYSNTSVYRDASRDGETISPDRRFIPARDSRNSAPCAPRCVSLRWRAGSTELEDARDNRYANEKFMVSRLTCRR